MLPIPTLQKFLRESFVPIVDPAGSAGEGPPSQRLLTTRSSQRDWLEKLSERLLGLARVYSRLSILGSGTDQKDRLDIRVEAPDGQGHLVERDAFHLAFEVRGEQAGLWLWGARGRREAVAGPIAAVAQIEDFLLRVRARQDQLALSQQRANKLVALKRRGLVGRLVELSAEHPLEYCVEETRRDIRLSLRLKGRKSGYHLTFAKGRLDGVLEELPRVVRELEHMRELGINFQAHNSRGTRDVHWITPLDR